MAARPKTPNLNIKQNANSLWTGIKNSYAFVFIVLCVLAGQMALFWRPSVGVYIEVLIAAIFMAMAVWLTKFRALALSAAILPVATMIAISIPPTTPLIQSMVYYYSILVLALVYRFIFTLDMPLSYTKLTAKGYIGALGLMAVIGELLGLLGYALLRHNYTFHASAWPTVLVSAAVFGITEEIFFRGLIQQRASQIMSPAVAAILTTLLYTVVSIGHITVWAPLFSLLLGGVLSFIYYKKQNLLLTITANVVTKLTYIGLLATFVFR